LKIVILNRYLYIFLAICICLNLSSYKVFAQSYNRSDWGGWFDLDGDCQNTRHELLVKNSLERVEFKDGDTCVVLSGLWFDEYTGFFFNLAEDVDIDHIIPLKYAFENGASNWDKNLKRLFTNDFENLEIVDDYENQVIKNDRGPSEYMPREEYHGQYAMKWLYLAHKYSIELRVEDLEVMTESINKC
jgi:hypothetical protein